jgi:hypothetical protein
MAGDFRDDQRLDSTARTVIQAVEPELRRLVGGQEIGPELIGELFLLAREALRRAGPSATHSGCAHELALTLYLSAVMREPDGGVEPDVLATLRSTIHRALERAQGAPNHT